ncbi:AMP-binding protein [Nocardioides kribbensis]|uniref:AMP-binding protein n=1 Tax=Nocardioides kribbensis TaxID=305517 RepID=UPI0032DBEA85
MTALPAPDPLGTRPEPDLDLRLDLDLLGGDHGDVALVDGERLVTYGELAGLVAARAAALGGTRRLLAVRARNDLDSVVDLLAAWARRLPVVLLGADDAARHREVEERFLGAGDEDLHPDLALLLSTSGSTGSPKLVRLSRANVLANADSIASYLALTTEDRAITSLPIHYCYGLSVLTSHLRAGAAVVLTGLSVTDECFWRLARRHRVTSLAGVPHTFDLLDASGFAERDLPDLRYLTQAGGRLAPATVRRFADLGRRRGWDLFVMYGATEATARMAYLPPHLAASRPDAIGLPVPGGDLRLAPVEGQDLPDGVGELVYSGPNVMMGYALERGDLARGVEHHELRTGDLGRQSDDGLWEVVGRLDRHVKLFGLRLDLGRLEEVCTVPVRLVEHDGRLHAFVDRPRSAAAARASLRAATGLPHGAVVVHTLAAVPLTSSGKVDHAALRRHAASAAREASAHDEGSGPVTAERLRDLYAVVLGRPDATTGDSFVDLGGDSLAFVETSTRLAGLLGDLPARWPHLTPVELARRARPVRAWTTLLEVPTVLRAVAILAIVASHTDLVDLMGGAHVLLAVAGYNVARFALPVEGRRRRTRAILAAVAAFAVPASVWILVAGAVTGDYRPTTALYLNQLLGPDRWTDDWEFWFLEVLVWSLLALAALLAVPAVDRWQRAHRFAAAMAAVVGTVALRFVLVGWSTASLQEYAVATAAFCVALGWAAAEARTPAQRAVVAAAVVVALAGYFGEDTTRQVVAVLGVAALLLRRPVRVPTPVARLLVPVAQASLWIYLTHWQVYPPLEDAGHPWAALVASLAVGLAAARAHRVLLATTRRPGPPRAATLRR